MKSRIDGGFWIGANNGGRTGLRHSLTIVTEQVVQAPNVGQCPEGIAIDQTDSRRAVRGHVRYPAHCREASLIRTIRTEIGATHTLRPGTAKRGM
jgi:hypothetical protein